MIQDHRVHFQIEEDNRIDHKEIFRNKITVIDLIVLK